MRARVFRFLVCAGVLWLAAEQSIPLAAQAEGGAAPKYWVRNGISVGKPKVFDNRTLTILLERLSGQLRTFQAVDQKSVAGALGNFQGYRVTDSAFAASVTGPSLPSIQNQTNAASGTNSVTTADAGNSATVTAPTNSSQ